MADIGEEINKQLADIVRNYFADLQKQQKSGRIRVDPDVFRSMEWASKNLSRMGGEGTLGAKYAAEQAEKSGDVKENIRYRAALREKKAMKFPNIASILAGGAQSPIAGLNQMQKQMSKPFKAIYDYKKAQEASAGFEGEMKEKFDQDPFYEMTKREKKRMRGLSGEEEGTKQRAGSGFGKNLMGKRMQGMIGKVGKFMESSKGGAALAGGMMGVSILTMVIKKAIEASPMLQAMLKIMNTAILLFLRPIGDFIGGMLKPIMLFFLKEVAVPMLKAGKGMIKFGEAVGRGILGFILKPVETIIKAIVGALSMIPFFDQIPGAQFWANYEPIADWMLDKRIDTLIAVINEKLPAGVAPLSKKDIEAFVKAGGDLEEFSSKQVHGPGGTYGPGQSPSPETLQGFMNLFPQEMAELVKLRQAQISADYTIIHEKLRAMGLEFGSISNETSAAQEALKALAFVARTGLIPEFENLEVTIEFLRKAIFQGLMPAWMAKLTEWAAAGKISKEELERAMKYVIDQGLHGWGKPLKYIETSLLKASETFGLVEGEALKVKNHMLETRKYAKEGADYMAASGTALAVGYNVLVKKIKEFTSLTRSRPGGGGNKPSPGDDDIGDDTVDTGGTPKPFSGGSSVQITGIAGKRTFQHGGMINEPIWGIGKSGRSYTLGESGPEMVTPMTGGKSTLGNITANITINIEKVLHNVDLEQIKPIVERALLEVHAKRGII